MPDGLQRLKTAGIVIKGGDITFTMPGKFTVKGAGHEWSRGGGDAPHLPSMPDTRVGLYDEQIRLVVAGTEIPLGHTGYRITASNGDFFEGVTDESGFAEEIVTDEPCSFSVEILDIGDSFHVGDKP